MRGYERRRPEETALWQTVSVHLGAFEAAMRDESEGRELPGFVRRELAGYLSCGLLARGFAHVRCGDCGASRLVAFACKARGFCPSCLGRRMCEGATRLVDERLPEAPVLPDGRLRITLKRPYRDGTRAVELAPHAFMARLAALVPAPRLHLVRYYHGLLAPRSRHRRDVVPAGREEEAAATATAAAPAAASPARAPSSRVPPVGRAPQANISGRRPRLPRCGGTMKLVALVKDP